MVGSALVRALRSAGYEHLLLRSREQLDLTRQAEVEAFFDRERPEHVLLAAAKVGGILANNTYRADFIRDNIAIAVNVIDAAYRSGVRSLLNLGSSCIYPRNAPQPLREESLLTGELEPTNEPYAIAKIAAIKMCGAYNAQHGTNFISVMPTNLYGPNDNFNLETAHVLPALIRKFELARLLAAGDFDALRRDLAAYRLGFGRDAALGSAPADADDGAIEAALAAIGVEAHAVTLWGSGAPRREFLHADDLAAACLHLMQRYDASAIGEFVNIGVGEDHTIAELAAMIARAVGFGGELRHDASKPDGTPRKLMSVERLHALGWRATIGLQDGLERTVAWYRNSVADAAHAAEARA